MDEDDRQKVQRGLLVLVLVLVLVLPLLLPLLLLPLNKRVVDKMTANIYVGA